MSIDTSTARRAAVIAATSGLLVTLSGTGAEAHVRYSPPPPPPHTHAQTAPSAQNLSVTRSNIMALAARYVGTPYRWGGTTPSGFDCSGFTSYVFARAGVSLPRTSSAQAASGRRVSRAEALPGDLVHIPGHIGIYAGGGMMYDSPRRGKTVSKRAMWSADWVYIRVLNG